MYGLTQASLLFHLYWILLYVTDLLCVSGNVCKERLQEDLRSMGMKLSEFDLIDILIEAIETIINI